MRNPATIGRELPGPEELRNGRADNDQNLRPPLAWLAVEKLTLENVAECGIEKAVEPSDRIELLHIDKAVRHAGWIDMHINDFANNQRMPVGAKLQDAIELAFEMDRHLFDPRRRDFDARDRRKTGFGELGIVRREGIGRVHHFSPYPVTTLKQNSPVSRTFLSVCFSVPSGLRAIVSEIIGGNDTDHGEEEKRREISDAALAYCRCPADGARHYGAGEESVGAK